MTTSDLAAIIDAAWEARDTISPGTKGAVRDAVEAALTGLDNGTLRVAAKVDGKWRVDQWLKKAVLLSFRLNDMSEIPGGPGRGDAVVGQGAVEIRRLDRHRVPRRRFPRRAGLHRPPLRLSSRPASC